MINTYRHGDETWIDIDRGTPDEIHKIMNEYHVHPFVAKELSSKTPKARIELHDDYIYCILHFPAWKHTHSEEENQEIDFVVGKENLITARYDTIDALHKFGKDLEVGEILNKKHEHGHKHYIFTNILRALYASIFEELEYIEDLSESITNKIFKGKEREMVLTISEVTRTVLNFKKVLDMHGEILEGLRLEGKKLFGTGFEKEMDSVITDYHRLTDSVKANLEMVHELRATDNSLLNTKQNETIKRFTIIGSVLFILSILATIFFSH